MKRTATFVLFGCWVVSCGSDPLPMAQPTLSSIQQVIFNNSCTFSSCHSVAGHKGNMILVAGQSFANLVNQNVDRPEALARGKKRVIPGSPDQSFLIQKLEGTFEPDEGDMMPRNGDRLPQPWIDAILEWIRRGAAND